MIQKLNHRKAVVSSRRRLFHAGNSMDNYYVLRAGVVAGGLFRDIRMKAGLSQRQLARAAHIAQSDVSKIESGEQRMLVVELPQICAACGVTSMEFMAKLEARLEAAGLLQRPTHGG